MGRGGGGMVQFGEVWFGQGSPATAGGPSVRIARSCRQGRVSVAYALFFTCVEPAAVSPAMVITQTMEVGDWPRAIASTQVGGGDLLVIELDSQLRNVRGNDAFVVSATAKLNPLGEPIALGVVFDRLQVALFDPSQLGLHVQPKRVLPVLFEAVVGEFIDTVGVGELLADTLNQIPFL